MTMLKIEGLTAEVDGKPILQGIEAEPSGDGGRPGAESAGHQPTGDSAAGAAASQEGDVSSHG